MRIDLCDSSGSCVPTDVTCNTGHRCIAADGACNTDCAGQHANCLDAYWCRSTGACAPDLDLKIGVDLCHHQPHHDVKT